MKIPVLGAPTNSLPVRLLWMAGIWAAGVACVFVVSLILRSVLHH